MRCVMRDVPDVSDVSDVSACVMCGVWRVMCDVCVRDGWFVTGDI